jgi:hypothetical protein
LLSAESRFAWYATARSFELKTTNLLAEAAADAGAALNAYLGPHQRLVASLRRASTLQLSKDASDEMAALLRAFAAHMRDMTPRALTSVTEIERAVAVLAQAEN